MEATDKTIKVTVNTEPYQIRTIQQFSSDVNRSVSQVEVWLNSITINNPTPKLDCCYPFEHNRDGALIPNSGPKFVVINEKAQAIIEKCKEADKKKQD